MDRDANLQVRPTINAAAKSSSSPPDFLRHVQAAFKRHRPLATTMQTNNLMPRRMLVPPNDASESTSASSDVGGPKKFHDVVISSSQVQARKDSTSNVIQTKNPVAVIGETQEDASLTPPSIVTTTITATFEESINPSNVQGDQSKSVFDCKDNNSIPMPYSHAENKRKVQFSMANNTTSQGADHQMATGLKNLSSHMSSLALTEMEWDAGNLVEALNIIIDESKHQNFQNIESDIYLRSNGAGSSLPKRTMAVQDQLHQLRSFLGQPVTQSSVLGTSCATTTSVHSTSAPIRSSTTYCSRSHPEGATHVAVDPLGEFNASSQHTTQQNMDHLSYSSLRDTSKVLNDQTALAAQASTTAVDGQIKEHHVPRQKQDNLTKRTDVLKNPSHVCENPTKEKGLADNATNVQFQDPSSKDQLSNAKLEPSKEEKQGKVTGGKGASVPHKKNYDPDLFFKVNGKLYQRLGKIGSGGSSEVHKVISSDCRIYALKKIKLKGRDYATAYGFCQEILYLNKLKGKNNIIQLIDYEVTDKNLLSEVMNESMNNKDGRVKDDGYIYMVLEYGEIDLAHMLSQKWKEIDCTNQTIDENWLRFYWQQILQAVNTIHEERIVHSDLKPANFLLVKGSLKLIDFGIAKAIMSDTTNIQRDSQVGTLSYMSPEAFMCNESDANGNIVKCGRSSDIWSLGCILYQMVYGRTPFAEYKTFWAKFKVITDPNHEITYEPVSNPWLLDLMKKCLDWDRNKRWRIPELLQHPFLVPPIPSQPSVRQSQDCKLLQLVSEACANNQEASKLVCELRQLLDNPVASLTGQSLTSQNQQCKVLLSQMSMLSFQLRECLSKSESE